MEVTPTQLLAMLREGTAPLKVRSAIARGALPLPPASLLEALDLLADDPEPAVQADALASIERLPVSVVRGLASATSLNHVLLDRLARRYAENESVALEIARNTTATDTTVAFLATLPLPVVLEVIGRNQGRLERSAEIVASLLANSETPLAVVELWQEHEERRTGAGAAAVLAEAQEAGSGSAGHDFDGVLVEESEENEKPAAALLDLEDRDQVLSAKQLSIYSLLKKMSIGQKVALAVKGNREVRNLLIRETNKMLCLKVLENPRISDTDLESYAKSTNVSEDVLRGIGNKKEWCKKYSIIKALVLNPKAPLGVTLDLVKRLTQKDLEQLAKNRNVPETLRSTSRRILQQKREAKGS